jgi:adenylate cyclase
MSQTRRLAAILAADVAGYSRLMGADEEGTLERLKALRRELIDPKLAEHHGRIVKTTGDGMLVEFASVVDAVRCAVAVQQAMPERDTGAAADNRIELRIGINLGDVIVEGDDLYGDGVNIAARIEALADAGGVFISNTVYDQVRDRPPFVFEDLGEQQVKNIARPVRVYRVRDAAIKAAAPPALPLPEKPSIAVLPFANMSGDPEQEYFADGITEDITTALSKVRWFFVIARNSAFTYKGRAAGVKQVGRELGVRYILEGSVRQAGGLVRITAQLIEAAGGNHVWAERYDRKLADIFAVQDEITERVVAAVEPELYAAENFRSQRKPPDSLDAWECAVRALSNVLQGTRGGNTEAEVLCRRAIAIAPSYGQAHSLLAWVLMRRVLWSSGYTATLSEAMAEARIALSLDERDPWAHFTHGTVLWRIRRHGEAEHAYRRALELNPNFALAHALLGSPLALQGGHEEAIKSAGYALRLSPNDPLVGRYSAFAMMYAHFAASRYADSMAWAGVTVERYPEHPWAYAVLVAAATISGEVAEPRDAQTKLHHLIPDFSLAWLRENSPFVGEFAQRLIDGLRKAGMPEK